MKTSLINSAFVSISLIFSVCQTNTTETNRTESAAFPNASKIIYHFGDSSVPPEYHRSYTITITKSNAHLVVDSYGNIVNEATVDVDEKEFSQLLETIQESKIGNRKTAKNIECTGGGTSETLQIYEGETVVFNGSKYPCGNSNLSGDINAV
jgi:hypothetical protein